MKNSDIPWDDVFVETINVIPDGNCSFGEVEDKFGKKYTAFFCKKGYGTFRITKDEYCFDLPKKDLTRLMQDAYHMGMTTLAFLKENCWRIKDDKVILIAFLTEEKPKNTKELLQEALENVASKTLHKFKDEYTDESRLAIEEACNEMLDRVFKDTKWEDETIIGNLFKVLIRWKPAHDDFNIVIDMNDEWKKNHEGEEHEND